MSIHDLRNNHSPPDPPHETFRLLKFRAINERDRAALAIFYAHVCTLADELLDHSYSALDGTLVLRFRTFGADTSHFDETFVRELHTWQELECIGQGEDEPCQTSTG